MEKCLQFTGGLLAPRLYIPEADLPADLVAIAELVERTANALGPQYFWAGLWVEGKLVQEWSWEEARVQMR